MKKLAGGCLALVLIFVAGYFLWVQFPRDAQRDVLEAAVKASDERFQKRQRLAADPGSNGYTDEKFQPWWAVKGAGDDKAPVSKAIRVWHAVSDEDADHARYLAEKNKEYLSARADFARLVPELQQPFSKPVFTPLYEDTGIYYQQKVPNFVKLRQLAQALTAYAASLAAEGRHSETVLPYSLVFELGARLTEGPGLIGPVVSASVQAIGWSGLLEHLPPDAPLSADQWRALSRAAALAVAPADLMLMSAQDEAALVLHSLATPEYQAELGADGERAVLVSLPGMAAREMRIYSNIMGPVLVNLQGKELITLEAPEALVSPDLGDFLAGRTGLLTQDLMPLFGQFSTRIYGNRRVMAGLATRAALLAYRAEKGELPTSLSALAKAGFEQPRDLPWDSLEYRYQTTGKGAELVLELPPPVVEVLKSDFQDDEGQKRFPDVELTDKGLVFRV